MSIEENKDIFLFDPDEHPHNRYNPLKEEWVLVSPHRTKRPWKGQVEMPSSSSKKKENIELGTGDEKATINPLQPGAIRSNGQINPFYTDTFVFDNDFPALFYYQANVSEDDNDEIGKDLFRVKPARGVCKVMCFHADPSTTLARMLPLQIEKVIRKWTDIYVELRDAHDWIQIFENKGATMGCSNPHPHGQIWGCDFLPNEIKRENQSQLKFYEKHSGKILLVEYLKRELVANKRVVYSNTHWACVVPYWAVWPYETMILPKRHIVRLDELTNDEIVALADCMKCLLVKYDNLFACEFPYSMGIHFAPSGRYLVEQMNHWQLHFIYLPPLLRSATVRKFFVGFEMLAQPQRDLTPEKAAKQLKDLSGSIHYSSLIIE